MSVVWKWTPPSPAGMAAFRAAAETAVGATAQALLEASQALVPVDTGALRDSGAVSHDGLHAAVSYGREDSADTAAYAVKQHEDMALNHPNGGQAKWLEQTLHAQVPHAAELLAAALRTVVGS